MCPPMEQVHRWLLWFSLVILLLKSLLTCTQHALSPIREKSMVPDETKQGLWKRLPYTLTEENFIKWFLLCLSQPDNPDMAHHINSLNFGSEIKVILRFTAVIVFVQYLWGIKSKLLLQLLVFIWLVCIFQHRINFLVLLWLLEDEIKKMSIVSKSDHTIIKQLSRDSTWDFFQSLFKNFFSQSLVAKLVLARWLRAVSLLSCSVHTYMY